MEYCLKQVSKHGIIDEEGAEADEDSVCSSSEVSSIGSLESDFTEVASSATTFSSPSSTKQVSVKDPLHHMSSDLLQQLPLKRGLSKHYQGKSQSFSSLSNVKCLEDLGKPENPYNKKLKYGKSYAGIAERYKQQGPPKSFPKPSCSSPPSKRNNGSFLGTRPPIPPHRSSSTTSFSTQTALFA